MNRNAQIQPIMPYIIIVIAGIIFGALLIVMVNQADVLDYSGETQQALMNVMEMNERSFTYLDALTSQSLRTAAEDIGKTGGYFLETFEDDQPNTPCGISAYPVWYTKEKTCHPNIKENIKERAEVAFKSRLEDYQEVGLTSSDFHFTTTDDQRYTFTVQTQQQIRIPIYKNIDAYFDRPHQTTTENQLGYNALQGFTHGSRGGTQIDSVVIHWTGGETLTSARRALKGSTSSYHYIIDQTGEIYQLVPEHRRANHAGCAGKEHACQSYNSRSIGISLVTCGYNRSTCKIPETQCTTYTGEDDKNNCRLQSDNCETQPSQSYDTNCYETYDDPQRDALVTLLQDIQNRQPSLEITEETLIGHDQIDAEKLDPGPYFNYDQLIQDVNTEATT